MPDSHRLRAHWQIHFVRTRVDADSTTLLLNSALRLSRLTGSEVLGFSRTSGDPDRIVVRLTPATRADRQSDIDLEYEGAPRFGSDSINNIGPGWVELGLDSFWQPIFADFGQVIAGGARVVLPPGWIVAASGASLTGDDVHLVQNQVPLPDVAFSASPELRYATSGPNRVYYTDASQALVSKTLASAQQCAGYLDTLFRWACAAGARWPGQSCCEHRPEIGAIGAATTCFGPARPPGLGGAHRPGSPMRFLWECHPK